MVVPVMRGHLERGKDGIFGQIIYTIFVFEHWIVPLMYIGNRARTFNLV